jgi:hypothetical protein
MVAMRDVLELVPTISLVVSVPGPLVGGVGWAWFPEASIAPVEEYAYTDRDLVACIRAFGMTVAAMLLPHGTPRFSITAYTLTGHHPVGMDHWFYVPESGRYAPHGDVWSTWTPLVPAAPAKVSGTVPQPKRRRFQDLLTTFTATEIK